jgi:hypothetical protein
MASRPSRAQGHRQAAKEAEMIGCGQEILVRDVFGQNAVRFIGQCGGRFMTISNIREPRNGYLLSDWRGVVRELVAMTVPASLRPDKGLDAMSHADGKYHHLPLSYPLSISGLAGLLGEDPVDVAALLKDLAVQAE